MITTMEIALLVLAAILGGVASAVLEYLGGTEPFNPRKFGYSLLKGVIGAVVAALTFSGIGVMTPWVYLSAFLMGAGVDILGQTSLKVYRAYQRK